MSHPCALLLPRPPSTSTSCAPPPAMLSSPAAAPSTATVPSGPPVCSATSAPSAPAPAPASAAQSAPPSSAPPAEPSRHGSPDRAVKKEPASPSIPARPRPKKLDLSRPPSTRPSAPLTAAIQDVGLACLSPGFQTNDPGLRSQLQRSLDVRDQQRLIIEARQRGQKVDERTPASSRRRGPPAGLTINAPSAAQFAHDRVIQSAPMNQTFTGLRPDDALTRNRLGQTSHMHHVPQPTTTRLPPIADVFANDRFEPPAPGPVVQPSPGLPPPLSLAPPRREYRSAEEAVRDLSGGREELMPKVVHYGGVQPPTPPSPMPPGHQRATAPTNGRVRGREEYERDNGSPPSSWNRSGAKRASYGMSNSERKDEFLRLCSQAWDLFHA
ncbi:hypothetical protein K470DRAFT_259752 [Piedraia hortae CBS 480.64]|uniref:Uncharacterized protein n=1 Tax=Piedraia hortae CBS 480.64 TaxID=1314780 RepID=A0A6A7BUS3_9PEZI|nr:hypothetical protein K470DRAFT_259752 [Piedraia hortae CBS 480.64]